MLWWWRNGAELKSGRKSTFGAQTGVDVRMALVGGKFLALPADNLLS